jgi:hypothetical protein
MREPDADGNFNLVTKDPSPDRSASSVLESLDKMRESGFFDAPITMKKDGSVDPARFMVEVISWRSKVMADKIARAVKDGSFMIASAGVGHLGYGPTGPKTISHYLNKKHIGSVSLGFTDGTDYFDLNKRMWDAAKEKDRGNPAKYAKDEEYEREALKIMNGATVVRLVSAAKTAGLSGFTLELHSPQRPFDYFVSLPTETSK